MSAKKRKERKYHQTKAKKQFLIELHGNLKNSGSAGGKFVEDYLK